MLQSKEQPGPHPTYMSEQQMADYLQNLRRPRMERPIGSRPAPPSRYTSTKQPKPAQKTSDHRQSLQTSTSMPMMKRPDQSATNHNQSSTGSVRSPFAGRPLVRPPSTTFTDQRATSPTPPEQQTIRRTPSITYTERGTRWMERQEVHSIRRAMEDMDGEAERRVHAAARDEAAELVWKHQNSGDSSVNAESVRPNPDVKRDYGSHLRKGSYRRSVNQEGGIIGFHQRQASSSSGEDQNEASGTNESASINMPAVRKVSPPTAIISVPKTRTPSGPSYNGLAEAVADDIARAHRRTSSGSRRIMSGEKKLFMHPDDRIWEDPQEDSTPQRQVVLRTMPEATTDQNPAPHAYIRKNPFARVRMQTEKLERSRSEPIVTATPRHHVEIQRNPPSQSRNPWYMSNVPLSPTPSSPTITHDPDDEGVSPKVTPTREGREIRSDDIRAATSKSRKDYSPKLPRPTFVSDKPGRPIVSFEEGYKPNEVTMQETPMPAKLSRAATEPTKSPSAAAPSQPSSSDIRSPITANPFQSPAPKISRPNQPQQVPVIPAINLPDDEPSIPRIAIQEETESSAQPSFSIPQISVDAPSISISGPEVSSSRSHRLSGAGTAVNSPRSSTSSGPLKSTPHYTPTIQSSGTLCAHCALPIAGRILSAAGGRFHPSCFNCHRCHTNLELVAFYPEPESQHQKRLARINARNAGSQDCADHVDDDSDDPSLRFYCHLDFHELFSPRCKSCRTPIEGEVIVACGAEWHVGHFFCAQCGDPFDAKTPFVEKEGYAWCVGCHTNRSAPKCRKCRKPVVDTVVKALGREWHQECFVCTACNADFPDGRFFLRRSNDPKSDQEEQPVCVACEERRLKA